MESTQLPPQQTPQRPRLERLRSDRAVAGVASGLARYLGVDVAWVRIGFVIAAIFGGTGLLMYLIGWVAMPEEGNSESIAVDKARDLEGAGSWVGLGLIALAAMIIVGNTGLVDGELVFAAALVAFGVLLYRGDLGKSDKKDDAPGSQESLQPYVPEAYGAAAPVAAPDEADALVYGRAPFAPVEPPLDPDPAFQTRPYEQRPSSPLGRFVMAVLLIVVGVMGVGHTSGWLEPSPRHYAAAVFIVLGGGLLVSSLFGRARWLIVVGLVLSPLLLGASLIDVPLQGGFGDPRYTPQSAIELDDEYRLIAGELVLDLTSIELADGESYEIDASVVFGRLEVILPPDLGVEVTARLDAGEMALNDVTRTENINVERVTTFDGSGQVVLDVHVGFGELVVREAEEVSQ